jgi:cell wall-associated NlpC family hydrolase
MRRASNPIPKRLAAMAATTLLAAGGAAPVSAADATPAESFLSTARSAMQRAWTGSQDLALFALGMIGIDYRWGGANPETGFDCSGLVHYVFQQVTGISLPRTSKDMSKLGHAVDVADLAVGDLVFFDTRRFRYSHVGIYLGDGRFIHAPSAGGSVEVVRLSESYWQRKFNGARRIVGALPDIVPPVHASSAQPPAP